MWTCVEHTLLLEQGNTSLFLQKYPFFRGKIPQCSDVLLLFDLPCMGILCADRSGVFGLNA